ncbi:DUF6124 family protein [Pseudomonas sp. PD9R]|uniref:DUF6124 family protein n=1 Tax=Pseudomonas sp. PD9R TaxID=2853534 RepID=UPI001C46F669|nr:DUF6124 family protein [Pseudomonas sp. PD9R]MBV6826539.1 hypothetical protein [Pseudomonas sp. PD9R]
MFKVTPNPPDDSGTSKTESRSNHLFTVADDINIEALLANASEDLLSISAIAADLADDVDGSRRSVALAISRMADGVHLLVERALDHLESPELLAFLFKDKPVVS